MPPPAQPPLDPSVADRPEQRRRCRWNGLDGTCFPRPEVLDRSRQPAAGHLWFDLDTHPPRRVEGFLGARREATVEIAATRLPFDERTRDLLDMPARPEAEREIVGASGR